MLNTEENKTINLVYFGSPDFSGEILEALIDNLIPEIKVVAVVTNPDKPVSRKQILTPSPVATIASKYHLPTFKPTKLDDANLTHLKLLKPDLFLVVAYGKVIPSSWLNTPKISTLNIHFSLLPKYRGALCIQEALKNQDSKTGVTLMQMDELLDHGPIISQIEQDIDINDDVASLTQKLTQKALQLLKEDLLKYLNGEITPVEQDHQKAVMTSSYKQLDRNAAYIPWDEIQNSHALIRSLNPQPGAWTKAPTNKGEIEIKILKTQLTDDKMEILEVQVPGKSPISWKQFLAGYKLA